MGLFAYILWLSGHGVECHRSALSLILRMKAMAKLLFKLDIKPIYIYIISAGFMGLTMLSGCSSADNAGTVSFTLSWDAPTQYENGDILTASTDLLEYRIYYSDSKTSLGSHYLSVDPDLKSFKVMQSDLQGLSGHPKIYVAMTSVSKNGIESVFSDIVSYPR